ERVVAIALPQRHDGEKLVEGQRELVNNGLLRFHVEALAGLYGEVVHVDVAAAVRDVGIEVDTAANAFACQLALTVVAVVRLKIALAGEWAAGTPVADRKLEVAVVDVLLLLLELDTTGG